jgi:hypothetical protein
MWKRFWLRFLARFRIDVMAVCEASRGMGMVDYHDYPDDVHGKPDHFCVLTCVRCGKAFII